MVLTEKTIERSFCDFVYCRTVENALKLMSFCDFSSINFYHDEKRENRFQDEKLLRKFAQWQMELMKASSSFYPFLSSVKSYERKWHKKDSLSAKKSRRSFLLLLFLSASIRKYLKRIRTRRFSLHGGFETFQAWNVFLVTDSIKSF